MANAKISNYKMLSARFLLAGILFFSFIAIAGYRASSNSIFPQKGQTELIYSNKGPGANKTGLYRKVLLQKNKKAFLSHHNNLISLLIFHSNK